MVERNKLNHFTSSLKIPRTCFKYSHQLNRLGMRFPSRQQYLSHKILNSMARTFYRIDEQQNPNLPRQPDYKFRQKENEGSDLADIM
jgi:hypothetical protein